VDRDTAEVKEPTECARALFKLFVDAYHKNLGKNAYWAFRDFDEGDASEVGLTMPQLHVGLDVLKEKGLVESTALCGNYGLTVEGKSACLHPETLDETLGPPKRVQLSAIVFNGPMHNTQIGDGNVQTVTYSMVLQNLVEHIEHDTGVGSEQKSRWVDTLKEIAASALSQTAAAVISKLGGA